MAKAESDIKLPALAEMRDKPLRVAAFCRKPPMDVTQWSQNTHYSSLVGFFPKWEFVGCYAGQKYAEKTEPFMGGIGQLIYDCKNGKIDLIITKSPSTINRNIFVCINLINDLQRIKPPVGIYFENNGLYSLQEDISIYLLMLSALAMQESESKDKHVGCIDYSKASFLKRTRKNKDMTQQEVADRANINIRHYQMFECGSREITNASFRLVMTLCDVLGIDPKELMIT